MVETVNIADLATIIGELRQFPNSTRIREILGEEALKELVFTFPSLADEEARRSGDRTMLETVALGYLDQKRPSDKDFSRVYQIAKELDNNSLLETAKSGLFSEISRRIEMSSTSEYFLDSAIKQVKALYQLGLDLKDEELIKESILKYGDFFVTSSKTADLFSMAVKLADKPLLSKTAARLSASARSTKRRNDFEAFEQAYKAASLAEDEEQLTLARTGLLESLNNDSRVIDLYHIGYAAKDGLLLSGIFDKLVTMYHENAAPYRAAVIIGDAEKKKRALELLSDWSADYICDIATEMGDAETVKEIFSAKGSSQIGSGSYNRRTLFRAATTLDDKYLQTEVLTEMVEQVDGRTDALKNVVCQLYKY